MFFSFSRIHQIHTPPTKYTLTICSIHINTIIAQPHFIIIYNKTDSMPRVPCVAFPKLQQKNKCLFYVPFHHVPFSRSRMQASAHYHSPIPDPLVSNQPNGHQQPNTHTHTQTDRDRPRCLSLKIKRTTWCKRCKTHKLLEYTNKYKTNTWGEHTNSHDRGDIIILYRHSPTQKRQTEVVGSTVDFWSVDFKQRKYAVWWWWWLWWLWWCGVCLCAWFACAFCVFRTTIDCSLQSNSIAPSIPHNLLAKLNTKHSHTRNILLVHEDIIIKEKLIYTVHT